jgi:putative SOS response-associated peptidase YedK
MCGRVNVIDNPELQALLRELGIDLGLPSRSNIAPTEAINLVRKTGDGNEAVTVRWWLTPHWARQVDQKYSMFNARSETLATSRAFAEPFKRRRGIVPVTSFIEWRSENGARQPYLIQVNDNALALAAIWDRWEGEDQVLESCALVTTAAAPQFQSYHTRMPVMLVGSERERWLDCQTEIAANDPLFAPRLKQSLELLPLSHGINNARNKELELLAPAGEVIALAADGVEK